jgi:hypothetical protein
MVYYHNFVHARIFFFVAQEFGPYTILPKCQLCSYMHGNISTFLWCVHSIQQDYKFLVSLSHI